MAVDTSSVMDPYHVAEFDSYEEYLDSMISKEDLYYLQDEELARQLIELRYRGSGDTLKREEFEQKKRELEELKHPTTKPKTASSYDKFLEF